MTIRAKLFAAIALTVVGPLVTIAVALHGQARVGERAARASLRSHSASASTRCASARATRRWPASSSSA